MEQPGPDKKAPRAPFFIGIEAFQRGLYFEAHEAWEDLWRESQGPRKAFLQGLIQAAVGLYHDGRGKPQAGLRMAAKALKNLESGEGGGLIKDPEAFKRWLESWIRAGRPGPPPHLRPLEKDGWT